MMASHVMRNDMLLFFISPMKGGGFLKKLFAKKMIEQTSHTLR